MKLRRVLLWVALLSAFTLTLGIVQYTLRSQEPTGGHHHEVPSTSETSDLSGEFLRAPLGVAATFLLALAAAGGLRWARHMRGEARRWPAQWRILALMLFLAVIIAAPVTQWRWGVSCAVVVLLGAYLSGVPVLTLARRLSMETPFLLFALALPFLSGEPYTSLGALTVSQPGLEAMFTILVTATLSVAATVVLISSMSVSELLHGLARLRVPSQLLLITGFALRYLALIREQWVRLQQARYLRGAPNPATPWYARHREYTHLIATVFLTAHQRAQRVHQAMLARGFR